MSEKLLSEIQAALSQTDLSSDGAKRLNLLALSGLISEVHEMRVEMRAQGQGLDERMKKMESYVPWLKGLAWFVGAVGAALVGVAVRVVFG